MKYRIAAVVCFIAAVMMLAPAIGFAQEEGGQNQDAQDQNEEVQTAGYQGGAVGGHLGYSPEIDGMFFVGAEGRFLVNVTPEFPITVNPSLSYYFPDAPEGVDFTIVQFEVNGLYNFPLDGAVTPYAGAGLAYRYAEVEYEMTNPFTGETSSSSADDSSIGINLIGGAEFDLNAPVRPFAQVRFTLGAGVDGDTPVMLMAGAVFDI